MSHRDPILEQVRRNQPARIELPDVVRFEHPPIDATTRFAEAVQAAGGHVIDGPVSRGIDAIIVAHYTDVPRIASAVPGVASANVSLDAVSDPRDLAALDLLVCEGDFGVAENGAVWLPESKLGHRAAPFLAQHLLVMLDRRQLVWNMHDAYARVHIDAEGFGVFVAGPSKTADIEQTLVVGAHGPRSFTVVMP